MSRTHSKKQKTGTVFIILGHSLKKPSKSLRKNITVATKGSNIVLHKFGRTELKYKKNSVEEISSGHFLDSAKKSIKISAKTIKKQIFNVGVFFGMIEKSTQRNL